MITRLSLSVASGAELAASETRLGGPGSVFFSIFYIFLLFCFRGMMIMD
jgi:hypothetical protein